MSEEGIEIRGMQPAGEDNAYLIWITPGIGVSERTPCLGGLHCDCIGNRTCIANIRGITYEAYHTLL